jgi:hypothetical protein
MREKEKERVYEKKLLKERTEEDKEFGDKPKFMTSAYKKKLLEDQKWEYEDRCVFNNLAMAELTRFSSIAFDGGHIILLDFYFDHDRLLSLSSQTG